MKIVRISNFADEQVTEQVACENVATSVQTIILAALRATCHANDTYYYALKHDDYVLWAGRKAET